ncbi:MAG: hypothetical protein WA419_19420 [Silvibacterium sp.]
MAALAAAALTVWLWSPALHFGFIYDDHLQIESNPWVQSWGHLGQLLREPLWAQLGPERASPWYRPLFAVLLLLQYTLFGPNAELWHLAGICLHVAVVLTLFFFLLLQFRRLLPAFSGACLFACSPVTAEVVNWVSASDEALYTLLSLLAFCALALCAQTGDLRRVTLLQCCSAGLLTLAVFAKETAIVGVVLALSYTWLLLRNRPSRRSPTGYAVYLFPVATFFMAHLSLRSPDTRSGENVTAAMTHAALLALRKLLWPVPVSEFYSIWLNQAHTAWSTLGGIGTLLLIGIACWFLALRSRFVAWALLVVMLPVAACVGGIFLFRDYDLFHDRYLYLPAAGCAMLLASAVAWAASHTRFLRPVIVILGVVLCLEVWWSRSVSQQFRNDLSLYSHAVQVAPRNIVALQLLAETEVGMHDCPAAIAEYRRAEQLRPDLWKTRFYLGIGYLHCGEPAAAEEAFVQATNVVSATTEQAALAWYELGRVRLARHDLAGAEVSLRQAAMRDPGSWKIRSLLAQVRSQGNAQ